MVDVSDPDSNTPSLIPSSDGLQITDRRACLLASIALNSAYKKRIEGERKTELSGPVIREPEKRRTQHATKLKITADNRGLYVMLLQRPHVNLTDVKSRLGHDGTRRIPHSLRLITIFRVFIIYSVELRWNRGRVWEILSGIYFFKNKQHLFGFGGHLKYTICSFNDKMCRIEFTYVNFYIGKI